ncbi:MAG: hypothetical protein AAFQ21_13250 [Pseudomonadota bacterium]
MNLSAFFDAPILIQVHASAAMAALLFGLSIFVLPKGRLPHRTLGVACAVLLLITAGTAAFIINPALGTYSWIHGFIPLTLLGLFGLAMGLSRKNFKRHRDSGRALIFGALLTPFIFAVVIDGRLMNTVFFG